jgi:hypothetical protein
MLLQGQTVVALTKARVTGQQNFEQLWLGELAISEVMPRYSALAKSGFVFTARGALQTLSAVGTGMTGLIVWNSSPQVGGGSVDLHIMKISGDVAVTSASMTGIALARETGQTAAPTGTTAASSYGNNYLGGSAGAGIAYIAATLSTAPVPMFDVMHNTVAIATTGEDQGFYEDLEGSIVVPPGGVICFAALGAASAASAVNVGMMWAELPV